MVQLGIYEEEPMELINWYINIGDMVLITSPNLKDKYYFIIAKNYIQTDEGMFYEKLCRISMESAEYIYLGNENYKLNNREIDNLIMFINNPYYDESRNIYHKSGWDYIHFEMRFPFSDDYLINNLSIPDYNKLKGE